MHSTQYIGCSHTLFLFVHLTFMFKENDIADYYDQTIDHYKIWWNLNKSHAVHFGYWDEDTKFFNQALQKTNQVMASLVEVKPHHQVLDAGCGVGGAAFYLARRIGCQVTGITLSEKQLKLALIYQVKFQLVGRTNFYIQNFLNTNFDNQSFDVVWACESSCYANDKTAFLREVKRILKPSGKIVVADYFLTETGKKDQNQYIKRWGDLWAISKFHTEENFIDEAVRQGFKVLSNEDVSKHVQRSSRYMYWSYFVGILPALLYNLFHKTSRFAKNHYQSGYYQYKALKDDLWQYRMVVLQS